MKIIMKRMRLPYDERGSGLDSYRYYYLKVISLVVLSIDLLLLLVQHYQVWY